ncbi:MAG: conjugal transfer protein TraR [Moraxella sp.]|jgi:transcriptional regulator, traR/dksA family|nr:MAG: conjugal transfer protein TraR [Moraxella sp.]
MNIEKYKTALLNLKNEYQSRIDKISDHIYHPQDDLNHHWTDQAVASQENDMRKNLLFEAEQSMTMVNNALLRIENGSYGICAKCGEEIEPGRLDAIPYAWLCVKHAQ